jgi:hypothetical protein
MERYCLIPDMSHNEEITRTAPINVLNTYPNSFSISRTAKKEGCTIKYNESPIVKGARIKA